jgi:two-component system, cell cycle sensor histidine kinase and response regulator CckA
MKKSSPVGLPVDWEKVLNAMSDGVAVVGRDRRFVWINAAMERFLGLAADRIVGKMCHELVHGTRCPVEGCPLERLERSGAREISEIELPARGLWIRVTVDPFFDGAGELAGAIHVLADVTASKRAEEQALFQSRRLEVLSRIDMAALREDGIEVVLDAAMRGVCRLLKAPRCAVRLFGSAERLYEHREEEDPSAASLPPLDRCPPDSPEIFASDRSVVVNTIREGSRGGGIGERTAGARPGARMAMALRVRDETIGVLIVDSAVPRRWTGEDEETAEAVARQVAIAVRHARVFRDRQELAEQLLSLMNNVPGVVYRGQKDWSLTVIGAEVFALTGFAPEEFTGGARLLWRDLVHPDDLDGVKRAFSEAVRAGRRVVRVEYRIRHRDGGVRWLADRRQLIYGADGTFSHVDGLLLDITDRKCAEAAFRDQLHFLQVLLDAIPNPVFYKDTGRVFMGCNKAFEDFIGRSRDGIIGKTVYDVAPKDLADVYREADEALLRNSGVQVYETRAVGADGTRRDVLVTKATFRNADGSLGGLIGAIIDITERKRMEESLRESTETLQTVIEASPHAIFALDLEGRITLWNRASERIFGWSEREAVGRSNPIVPEEKQEEFRGLRERVVREGGFFDVELTRRKKDGSPIAISLSSAAIRNRWGAVIGFMAIASDISERKRMEAALKESEEQLRQSQKMEAVGRLAGGIAHDFNNVLTAILGYGEILRRRLGGDEGALGDLGEIVRCAERASSLTRQLLAFGRRQVLQPKVLNLNAVVANMENMLRRLIGEDIELAVRPAPGLWAVSVDPGQIEQVLMNLAVNARDAMPGGGRLLIETRNVDLDGGYLLRHSVVRPGSYVMIAVSDTGIGMDEETASRVFEPFFTTKAPGKGTGLGLSTVYGIVKQSGGYVWVYSEPGKGTTFKVYLPRHKGEAEDEARSALHAGKRASPPRGQETVLLVEDDSVLRRLFGNMLRTGGYRVLEAGDGTEAIRVAEGFHEPIHLVVTDVVMPRLGGRDLAKALSRDKPDAKILYMSGYTDDAIFRNGDLDRGKPFIQKPFTLEALLRTVREVLDG